MKTILVVANETLGGAALLERDPRARRGRGRRRPRRDLRPAHEARATATSSTTRPCFDAAQVRIDLARSGPARRGHRRDRRGRRPRPVHRDDGRDRRVPARRDHHLDLPGDVARAGCGATSSSASPTPPACPVEHVVADLDSEGLPFNVTLVVANRTGVGDAAAARRSPARPRATTGTSSSSSSRRRAASGAARAARARAPRPGRSTACAADGLLAAGMIGDPDPYTATMNALQFFRVDDIVISTLPDDALGLAARRPHRARAQARRACPSSTSPPRPRPPPEARRSTMEAATIADGHADARRAPRAAAGQPQLARRAPAARDAAFHHLRDHGLRRLLHGLLLHPGRDDGDHVVPDRTGTRCRSRSPASTRAILRVVVVHAALGARRRSRTATASA